MTLIFDHTFKVTNIYSTFLPFPRTYVCWFGLTPSIDSKIELRREATRTGRRQQRKRGCTKSKMPPPPPLVEETYFYSLKHGYMYQYHVVQAFMQLHISLGILIIDVIKRKQHQTSNGPVSRKVHTHYKFNFSHPKSSSTYNLASETMF